MVVGHQQRRSVAVYTSDTRLASRIADEAASRGVRVKRVLSWDEIPLSTQVIISTRRDNPMKGHGHIIYAEDYTSTRAVIDRALELCSGKEKVREITISLDPGKRVGVAFIVDGAVIRTETHTDYENLAQSMEDFINNHAGARVFILAGSGAHPYRDEMLEYLRKRLPKLFEQATLKLVPEHGTSRRPAWLPGRRRADELAAAALPKKLRRVSRG